MNRDRISSKFNACYEADSDAIFRFCLLRISDREQAIDITQETFARFWKSLSTGDGPVNERAFLFTVAHRLVIDWYRRKKALPIGAMAGEDDGEPFDPPDERTLDGAGIGAESRFLLDSISRLGAANRQAVYLRFVEGLSPGEIGEILGVSAGAASVRVSRGLSELKKLTGYEDLPE